MAQLDLLGGAPVPSWPPPVPPVTFHPAPFRRNCEGQRLDCFHCQMNAHRFRLRQPVAGWHKLTDMVILKAVTTITGRDGSTLSLCAQHDREHQERGDCDG